MLEVIIFFILQWYISLFFQTFFHHRYSAHQMFKMTRFWEKVFYVMSWITQGSSYLSPYGYGILHRMHHAYADTEKDPHSPKYDSNLFSMMWRTKQVYSSIVKGTAELDERFTKELPYWRPFDKFASSWPSRVFWGATYVIFYWYFIPADQWYVWLLLPVQFMMSPAHGAVINWFAHKYGSVHHKTGDTSKNLLPVDILMMGESYHNNHHKFPGRPNFGIKWYQFDPTYPAIKLMSLLHIIKMRPVPTA